MSGGAKAGLAFGIILALGLIAGIVLFAIRRKRRQDENGHRKIEDEKSAGPFRSASSNNLSAPRLSLRPVTQFMGIGEPKVTEMTATGGLSSFPPPAAKRFSGWERRPTTANSDQSNPFGAHAETTDSAAAEKAAEQNALNAPIPMPMPAASTDPFADKHTEERAVSPVESQESATSPSNSPPRAQVGTAAAIAVAKPGNTKPSGPNNVHRVQLDFKPSMDDELDLHAGQVVRILHEYDDGWVSNNHVLIEKPNRLTYFSGSLHAHGPLQARRRPPPMPVQDAHQAAPHRSSPPSPRLAQHAQRLRPTNRPSPPGRSQPDVSGPSIAQHDQPEQLEARSALAAPARPLALSVGGQCARAADGSDRAPCERAPETLGVDESAGKGQRV